MRPPRLLRFLAGTAIVFGALTVFSGGRALFGGAEARAAVGNAVPFVLWFNFLAGFGYMAAGIGLWLRHAWAYWCAVLLALATALIALAFAVQVAGGAAFEMRTVAAMALRLGFWVAVAIVAHMQQRRQP